MGNRGGRIHDPATKTLTRRRWASRRWIACVLDFKGRHRQVWGESYTELFFLDEATALAAGHRPCFECRRADARRFAEAWARAKGLARPPMADEMDSILHMERLARRRPRIADPLALPDGAIVAVRDRAMLKRGGKLFEWTPDGYRSAYEQPVDYALPLTPPAIIAALGAGYSLSYVDDGQAR